VQFKYQAKNNKGKIITGLVQAINKSQAAELIEDKGLTVISLEEHKKFGNIQITFLEKVWIYSLYPKSRSKISPTKKS